MAEMETGKKSGPSGQKSRTAVENIPVVVGEKASASVQSTQKNRNAANGKPASRSGLGNAANAARITEKKPDVQRKSSAGAQNRSSAKMIKTSKTPQKALHQTMKKKEKAVRKPLSKKARLRRKKRIRRYIRRAVLCLFSVLAVAVFGVYMVLLTVFHGPSTTASELLVNTVLETSALKFVPYIYFSEEEVADIVARNAVEVPDEATDTSLVVIDRTPKEDTATDEEEKDIELVEVNGSTYHGYMLIVKDPSRVSLGVCNENFSSDYGKYLNEIAEENNAVAAINAGGFSDEGGSGRGGKPLGIVIKDGKVLNSKTNSECNVLIGFDKDDKLIVGEMTANEAIELGIRDAASFNPVLILNGEPASVKGSSSGLNPRTAIGQRADGAVLLLVIDGRQVNSMGASLADLIDVMMQFGAVNAANLDGGSSSKMYYEGEFVNDGVALTGSRRIPTAFIVK